MKENTQKTEQINCDCSKYIVVNYDSKYYTYTNGLWYDAFGEELTDLFIINELLQYVDTDNNPENYECMCGCNCCGED